MSLFPRTGDFSPLFRLLDDYDVHRSGRGNSADRSLGHFSPRFDVRETKEAYLLDGEIPGIHQKDVDIEFVDAHTLAIKGRVVREYHSNNNNNNNDEAETASNSSKHATHKFWVSERSVGEFNRTFNFPTRVDQDAVKASLKNGILSIVVPKASRPAVRKITIE
ncbi:HSP20-like chaperone [Talaromyces proteolyticus]|uniref:HSP20-like chaperone n=1 Tax=Talaromyces proteolyticus TaxID=1131652 RepID=A0AAD4KR63_9EURO|nr:HSP20-like chaperone [Talaromyces proteolyticus]KAH8694229.1 HSP20-like chaperone [Talaromyces proteolyticus]